MGRWTSPDPLGDLLGDPQTLNRYAYVRNAPVNYVDPLGLQRESITTLEDYFLINDGHAPPRGNYGTSLGADLPVLA